MSQATLVIKETPLDAIRLHPRNLRRQVGDVAEMAQSMKERVQGGQVTIADAEALAEFADEPAALKRLLSEAGTPMFQYAVERERRRREAKRRGAENRKQLEKAGIQIVEEPASFPWSSVEKPLSQLVDPEGEAPEGHVGPV